MPSPNPDPRPYCWFSHDVTKIHTTKLSILPRFYFHDVLEQLKNNFHTNFRFKRVLGFLQYSTLEFLSFCATRYLHDGQESCHVDLKKYIFQGILLSKQFMHYKTYPCNVSEFLEE